MRVWVTFVPRNGGAKQRVEVKVEETTNHLGERAFYATNLDLWGCGKNARTVEGAVRLLVQDMAMVLKVEQKGS